MEDLEKNDIQDAQVSEVDKVNEPKKMKSYRTEIILIFIIGLLLGIMLKAESLKKVSIGFSDYKVTGGTQGYDLDAIEEKLIQASKDQQEAAAEAGNQQVAPVPDSE